MTDWIYEAAERITCVARNWGAELVEHDNHLHLKADAVRIIKREHGASCLPLTPEVAEKIAQAIIDEDTRRVIHPLAVHRLTKVINEVIRVSRDGATGEEART